MDKKQRFLHILYGFLAGILFASALWLCAGRQRGTCGIWTTRTPPRH